MPTTSESLDEHPTFSAPNIPLRLVNMIQTKEVFLGGHVGEDII